MISTSSSVSEKKQEIKLEAGPYVHYGCGLDAPSDWLNFDISPSLRIKKIPILGSLMLKLFHSVFFPDNVKYGNIIKGLPNVKENSCNGVYCSHVLEHLSLEDCRIAIQESYKMLKPNGIFRCVLPDLEFIARAYVQQLEEKDSNASIKFMKDTILGYTSRPRRNLDKIRLVFGNANHLWMWDQYSLAMELEKVGFREIRTCQFNDCKDPMFNQVENWDRFENALALEAIK